MESQTYIKNLKISPKKLRFLLTSIKKMRPVESLESLAYMQKKTARFFYQAIKSAITNAKNTLKTDEKLLKFKVLTVEEGMRLKRFQPGGRGTAKPYKKRTAHIRIVLIADNTAKNKEKVLKEVKKIIKPKSKIKIQKSKTQIKNKD